MLANYPGSKGASGVWERIISEMPEHTTYVEGFAGSGVVGRRKLPAARTIFIDANPDVTAALAKVVPPGSVVLTENMFTWLRSPPAESVLQDSKTLLYLDPPYMGVRNRYGRFGMTPIEHAALLEIITGLPCMVMISGYLHPLYATELGPWRCLQFGAGTRGGRRIECLWLNFGAGRPLHDRRYVGLDYRERERIKKKRRRWAARFQAMAWAERQVIAGALADADRETLEAALRIPAAPPAVVDGWT